MTFSDYKASGQSEQQSGYTLVELMIGMLISLLVGGVALGYMVTSSRLLATKSSEDVIQENVRFAFETMASTIRLAGSNVSLNAQTAPQSKGIFISNSLCNIDAGSNACNQNNGAPVGSAASAETDRVAFEYIADRGKTCTGVDIPGERQVVTQFYIKNDGDNVPTLYCRAYMAALDFVTQTFQTYTVAGSEVPLISGVDALQVLYGVNTDGNPGVDSYLPYTASLVNDLDELKTIRLGLLVSNDQNVGGRENTEENKERTYTVLDGDSKFTDSILRRVVSTTVFLPNSDTGT